jgi:hypothetical protein
MGTGGLLKPVSVIPAGLDTCQLGVLEPHALVVELDENLARSAAKPPPSNCATTHVSGRAAQVSRV